MVGSGLATPELALRPTPAPTQTHSPCTFAREIAQGRPAEARPPTSLALDSGGLRPRALIQSSASLRPPRDGVRRMALRGRRPRACAAARARFSPIRPSYSPTVPRSALERTFASCPRAPAGGPLAELLGMSAGQVGRGPAAPERVAPAAERAERSTAERVRRRTRSVSSGSRFSAGMRAGVGAQGRLRDRSGRADACGPDDMRRVASGGRHGTSSARDGRLSHDACQSYPSARSRSACRMYGDTLVPV